MSGFDKATPDECPICQGVTTATWPPHYHARQCIKGHSFPIGFEAPREEARSVRAERDYYERMAARRGAARDQMCLERDEARNERDAAADYARDQATVLDLVAKALGVPDEPHQGRAERILEAAEGLALKVADLERAIKLQASAARRGMDAAKAHGGHMETEARRLYAESNPEALESERQANAQLTEENAALAAHVERARPMVEAYRSQLGGALWSLEGEEEEWARQAEDWLRWSSPATSLARLKAQWQAEMEELAHGQARRVRNLSDPDDIFLAVPLSILTQDEGGE